MIWGDQEGCRTYPPGPASCSRDWLWGRMAWVRRDSAAQSSCTERFRLRPVPRPCQPAPTPGQQPQPSKGHLEQKARPGKQHVRSHSRPSLTLWACAHSRPSASVSLNFPVPKQTMFTTLLLCLHHSLSHLCIQKQNRTSSTTVSQQIPSLKRHSGENLRCPKPDHLFCHLRSKPGPDSFLYWGPFSRQGIF